MSEPTAATLIQQARQAEHQGRFDQARDLLRQAAGRAEEPSLHLDANLRLGKLLVEGGAPCHGEADVVLGAARVRAEQEGALRQAASALHLLALLQRRRGNLTGAQELLDQSGALRLAEAPGPEVGQLLHYRGLVLADRNELAQAERLFFRALGLYQELDFSPGMAEVYDSLANLMLRRGKSRPALAFARRSLELKRKLGDRYGEAISTGTIGRAHLLRGRYDEAREAFLQDLAIATELNDQHGIGIMHNHLGDVELLRKDPEAARLHYEDNLKVDRGPPSTAHASFGLARAHLAAGRAREAEAVLDRAGPLLASLSLPGLAEMLIGLRGVLTWRSGDIALGEQLLVQAIDLLRKRQLFQETIPFLYDLRDLYYEQKDTGRAVAVMARALDLLSEWGSDAGVVEVEKWLRSVDSPSLIRLALERHFPDYLVESILTGKLSDQLCRRQEVTVLFSDIRNFTSLSERMASEEVVDLLNEWFTEATRAIGQHGGVVDKFIGDAVMALFGVPEPRPDAAADAVRAALAMRDALAAINQRHKALGGQELRIGVGVHTGEAVVGFIGSHLRQSYTAIGDTVNIASRLEGVTKKYPGCDIIISEKTQQGQQAYHVAETELGDDEKLKGRNEKVRVYLVRGLRESSPKRP
jgi:class 3 adenylate cyclase